MRRECVSRSPLNGRLNDATRTRTSHDPAHTERNEINRSAATFRQLQDAGEAGARLSSPCTFRQADFASWSRDSDKAGAMFPAGFPRRLCFSASSTANDGVVSTPAEVFYGCNTGRRIGTVLYRARSRDPLDELVAHAPVNIYMCASRLRTRALRVYGDIHVRAARMTDDGSMIDK